MAFDLYAIETAVFQKIDTLLSSTTGSQGELPATTTGATPRLFGFGIGLGEEPTQIPSDENYYALTMQMDFRGLYGSREEALDDISAIYAALPYDSSDITGIQRLDLSGGPVITRTIWERGNDQAHGGGEERLWAVQIPFRLTVENI